MSTRGKHRRWARKQLGLRNAAIRQLAIAIDQAAQRRLPPSRFPGLDALIPIGWPYHWGTIGSIGGRSRGAT